MKSYMFRAMFAIVAIGLALAPSAATAQDAKFMVTLTGPSFPVWARGQHCEYNAAGKGAHVGPCTAVFYSDYDHGWKAVTGSAVITTASGDELNISYSQELDGTHWVGEYTITGGTGRFTNASGSGDFDVTIDVTSETFTATFDGTISF